MQKKYKTLHKRQDSVTVQLRFARRATVSFLKKMRIKKIVYGTMKPSKIGGGFMNQYNIIVQQLLAYLTKRKQCSSSRLSHKQCYEEFGQYLEENNL